MAGLLSKERIVADADFNRIVTLAAVLMYFSHFTGSARFADTTGAFGIATDAAVTLAGQPGLVCKRPEPRGRRTAR